MSKGDEKVEMRCKQEKQPSPAQKGCLQPPDCLNMNKNARFLSPDSWTFKQNSQHEKCRALRDEFRDIKKLT